jgi:protein-disulfide isomerase
MRLFERLSILAACAVALAGCERSDQAFDNRVHAYLLKHPEVLQEVADALHAKEEARAVAMSEQAIGPNRPAIERDPRDFVANPNGAVTVTEFYDYRCPHCINAAPAVLKLIKNNPDVRFVFKEYPIFGPKSETAAAAAIAVKRAGGDYLGVYSEFMAARPLDEAAIDRILGEHGIKPDALQKPDFQQAATDQLVATQQLAAGLGLTGTPAFIIGDTVVPGDRMDAVQAAIASARTQAHKG